MVLLVVDRGKNDGGADAARGTLRRVGLFVHSFQASGRDILEGIADRCPGSERLEYVVPFPLDRPFCEHRTEGFDGLIVRIDRADDPALGLGTDLPRVLIAAAPIDDRLDLVWDNVSAGRLAAEHFLELGHRSFAFVGRLIWSYQVDRLRGFQEALGAAGVEPPRVLDVGQAQESHAPCQRLIAEWLPGLPPGTALLAATDPLGQDVLGGARSRGLAVPEDLAVVTIGNDRIFCEMSGPSLSGVTLPGHALGRAAVALLMDRIEAGELGTGPIRAVPATHLEQRRSSDLLRVDDPEVARAVGLIRAQATRGLSVPDVHRSVPLSRRALELRFKKCLGRTMQQEICRVQVAAAKRLLTNTNRSMAEIADEAGFPNAQRLSVVFAREVGRPPVVYRRQTRSLED